MTDYTIYKVAGRGCHYCDQAATYLQMLGLDYQAIDLGPEEIKSKGFDTVPQIFHGQDYVGGLEDLLIYLNNIGLMPLFQPMKAGLDRPFRGTPDSAGMDLSANFDADAIAARWQGVTAFDGSITISPNHRVMLGTGWAVKVPKGTYGRIAPRSGLAYNHGLQVLAGVVDRDFTGEVNVILHNSGFDDVNIRNGDRIAQLVIEKIVTAPTGAIMATLPLTIRGDGGYGSTGR